MTKLRRPPVRTCVACRTTSDKRELVRVVRTPEGDVHVDCSGKSNGRGSYVCLTQDCIDSALARHRFDSALRVNLKEDDLDRLRRELDALRGEIPATDRVAHDRDGD